MTSPWLDPNVARAQRQLVDEQLQANLWPPHFSALAEAVRATQCPGELLVVGCGVGHEREVLDRAGVEYRGFAGIDISPEAIRLARERYPESTWVCDDFGERTGNSDIVVDSACLMHVDDWRAHLAALCRASRRWVVLHRAPVGNETDSDARRITTKGYGHEFDAWEFGPMTLTSAMRSLGFERVSVRPADGGSVTLTYARPRHWVTYCDSNYLSRLKALHASMMRRCGPFKLHVLAWDVGVGHWASGAGVEFEHLGDFLVRNERLQAKNLPGPPRTRVEHMWTCGPQWIADVMGKTGEPVTYVDADVMFFNSPEPVFAEIGGAPAAVVPHGFARAAQGLPGPTVETHEVFGRFNVGIVYAADRELVAYWAAQCRAWCYDRIESDERHKALFYGDQRYLNSWDIAGAHVVQHPGACLGPWAIHTRSLDVRDGVIHFGNRPLVAYHFSSYREGPHGQEQLSRPEYQVSARQGEIIYAPYVKALQEAKR